MWESNPHLIDFKSIASASWANGPFLRVLNFLSRCESLKIQACDLSDCDQNSFFERIEIFSAGGEKRMLGADGNFELFVFGMIDFDA